MVSRKDTVFSTPLGHIDDFEFNAQVADVFENMIQRSVPGYALLLEMIGMLTGTYAQAGTNCYDLGCSLGASTLKIRQNLPGDCLVIGIDSSEAMVEKCIGNIHRDHSQAKVTIRLEDLQDTIIENASMVVMNFSLQFIADEKRSAVLKRIADGINEGGVLILSEKIKFEDTARQELMTGLHLEFKKHHGYSDLEIAQKRASLENVLVPNTTAEHVDRLKAAGFSTVELIVRCLNFVSFLAIK
ncbi:MAG: carboxy-S-adenosyl-L-methionine synthase CmoA [Proteobacteria bacterium]|nr:carboxy-S-adenosyl-L-methionine synthase CmoA [Pseudomonadota bacterium]